MVTIDDEEDPVRNKKFLQLFPVIPSVPAAASTATHTSEINAPVYVTWLSQRYADHGRASCAGTAQSCVYAPLHRGVLVAHFSSLVH
jgi:hypothetical protein